MLLEIRAEIAKLLLDLTFVRNLSCVFLIVFACCYGLFELHSQNEDLGTRTSINRIQLKTPSFKLNTRK